MLTQPEPDRLILNAYVMAADPGFLTESVLSYYDIVNKIVVSYDQNGVGWKGGPIPVDECLAKLAALDSEGKIEYLPGVFSHPEMTGVEADTKQRQASLNAASAGADWVLQLDTDEVLSDPDTFLECLNLADASDREALDYPLRYLFAGVNDNHYLEVCTRFWRVEASYPGPVAVKKGTTLRLCRQTKAKSFRVDFRVQNTDPKVDKVIAPSSAIWHFSLVRDEQHMLRKSKWNTHASDFDWSPLIRQWMWSKRHPYLAVLATPFRRAKSSGWVNVNFLRLTKVLLRPRAPLRQVSKGSELDPCVLGNQSVLVAKELNTP